jgi:isopenicillin-N epimerase
MSALPIVEVRPPGSQVRTRSAIASHWELDPAVTFLNHGSYGAVPIPVRQAHDALRRRMEREPVRFFKVDLEHLMDGLRSTLGRFLNTNAMSIAPVANATIALCTILNNTTFAAGDEVIVTDHEYASGLNELSRLSARTGLKIVTVKIPMPCSGPEGVLERVLDAITPRTKMVLISHITSPTSLILPVEQIAWRCRELGIETLIDGTHAPGQIAVDIARINPTYYVGSGHKWLSSPKGTGFMYVAPEKQEGFRTLALSSRAAKIRPDRPLFLRDFDYMGTDDYTNLLAMKDAIEFMGALLPGGWDELRRRNHELVLRGRRIVAEAIADLYPGMNPACPESMVGSMATILLPDAPQEMAGRPTLYDDPLQDALIEKHKAAVPIWRLPTQQRVLRVSAQVYNQIEDYEILAGALRQELESERGTAMRKTG